VVTPYPAISLNVQSGEPTAIATEFVFDEIGSPDDEGGHVASVNPIYSFAFAATTSQYQVPVDIPTVALELGHHPTMAVAVKLLFERVIPEV
jgi:hypothetical protein